MAYWNYILVEKGFCALYATKNHREEALPITMDKRIFL